jgi:ATP-dependent Clp protease ATP-binding subunit ClpA
VRDKVEEAIGPAGSAPTGSPPFTPRAKKVLELSLREALQLGHNYIGTEHMLLGLIREGEGVAAQVLVSLGADLARVREAVLNLLSEYERRSGRPAPRGLSITTREAAREGASDSAWESAWAAAGTASVGKELLIEVVREGRRPEDYTAAYRELAQLLQRHGWVLDDLDAAEITVTSVETSQGPGLRVRVRHRIEEPAAEPDEPDLRSG